MPVTACRPPSARALARAGWAGGAGFPGARRASPRGACSPGPVLGAGGLARNRLPTPRRRPAEVVLTWPDAGRGRPRKNPLPDPLSRPAEAMLAEAEWTELSWRTGTKGALKASFAAVRVRVADGPPQRILDKGQQHLPGEEAWLVGEHRVSGERKYYLSNLPADADLRRLAAHHQGPMGVRASLLLLGHTPELSVLAALTGQPF